MTEVEIVIYNKLMCVIFKIKRALSNTNNIIYVVVVHVVFMIYTFYYY